MGVLSWGALCRAPMCALYRTLLLLVLVIVISSAQPHIERPSGANRLGDLFQYRWPSARGAAEPEELPPSLAVEVPSVGDVDPPSKQDQASQRARELREAVPRFVGPSDFDANDNQYWRNLVLYFAFGIAMAGLNLVFMFIYCACQCCACFYRTFQCLLNSVAFGLCQIKLTAEEHEKLPSRRVKCKRYCPWTWLALFCCATAAFCSVALTANQRLHNTLTGDSRTSLTRFVPPFVDEVGIKIDAVGEPISVLNQTFDDAVEVIEGALQAYRAAALQYPDVVPQVEASWRPLNQSLQAAALPSRLVTAQYTCTQCAALAALHAAALRELDTQLSPSMAELHNVQEEVSRSIVEPQSDLRVKIVEIETKVGDIRREYQTRRRDVQDVLDEVKLRDNQRHLLTGTLFSVPLSGFLLVIMATMLQSSVLFRSNIMLHLFVMVLMWALFAIHFPLAVLTSDVCIALDSEQRLVTTRNDTVSTALSACLQNSSLQTVYNATTEFAFTSSVRFPPPQNFTQLLRSPSARALAVRVDALTLRAFAGPSNASLRESVSVLQQISALVNQTYTAANLSALNASAYPSQQPLLGNLQEEGFLSLAAEAYIAALQANASLFTSALLGLRDQLDHIYANTSRIEDATNPLLGLASGFLAQQRCGFIGDLFRVFKTFLCENVMDQVSVLAMSMFFLSTLGVFVVLFSHISSNTFPSPYPYKAANDRLGDDRGSADEESNVSIGTFPELDDQSHIELVARHRRSKENGQLAPQDGDGARAGAGVDVRDGLHADVADGTPPSSVSSAERHHCARETSDSHDAVVAPTVTPAMVAAAGGVVPSSASSSSSSSSSLVSLDSAAPKMRAASVGELSPSHGAQVAMGVADAQPDVDAVDLAPLNLSTLRSSSLLAPD